ncbi:MAG TPA: 4Fe-4S binding protein [Candidatus Bathyarchaeia archaeon]|nr:4Fe-4S binding protein [Candidatus Bathyarchaeia archaeon]
MGSIAPKIQRIILYFANYPKIGKFIGSILAFLEVPWLEWISFKDKYIRPGSYKRMMKTFTLFYSSRIIPLNIKIEGSPSVAPTEEIMNIIRRMPAVSIGYCYCRTKYQNCNNPLWTCIHIGTAKHLDELSKKIPLRNSSHDEIEKLLLDANKRGLVHQLLTSPNSNYVYVICNCCPCCCVMLKNAIQYNFHGVVTPSNFINSRKEELCQNCGMCVERCHFGAISYTNNKLGFEEEKCVGCGLCISSCKNKALILKRRISIIRKLK